VTDTLPVAHIAFSAAWAEAWGRELNTNPVYRQAAAKWEGDIVLAMGPADGAATRAVYLDLWHGVCRAARAATAADLAAARYVFQGTRDAWQAVLQGTLAPTMAIMTGKLKLTRGSLMDFLPYAGAADALLVAGGTIATTFLEE
jgi:putative sterol carrier protein